MSANSILSDLDKLIKKASEAKAATLKEAAEGGISAKLDNAEDGTSPASTGAQAAAMERAEKETYPKPAVDVDGEDNKVGESVDESTAGSTAVSADGQEGTQGSKLEGAGGVTEAANGPTTKGTPENNGFNSGAFKGAAARKELAGELRKQAAALKEAADSLLTPLDRFLVKSARSVSSPQVKKAMDAMNDAEVAGVAGDNLLSQIEGGQIGEEEAAQILQEAIASGAVSEEELAEAAAALGGGGEGAPPPSPEMMVGEGEMPGMEAKLAAAHITPDHPDYVKKLASLYPEEVQSGVAFCLKLAEELVAEESEEGEEKEEKEETTEETEESGEGEEKEETEEVVAPAPEGAVAEMTEEVAPTPAAPPMGPMGEVAPQTPEEAAALAAVQQELGMDDAALMQLMAAEGGAPIGKLAAALEDCDPKTKYRTIILNKVAALRR